MATVSKREFAVRLGKVSDWSTMKTIFKEFMKVMETELHASHDDPKISDGELDKMIHEESLEKGQVLCQFSESKKGDVLGMTLSCTHPVAFFGPILMLTLIYVRKRGSGLGTSLMDETMAESDRRSLSPFRELHLIFNEGNDAAWNFYTRYGIENLTKDYGISIYQFGIPELSKSDHLVRLAQVDDRLKVISMIKDFRVCCSSPFWENLDSEECASDPLENLYVSEQRNENGNLELTGFLSHSFRYGGLTWHTPVIFGLYVKEPFRRQGVGSALMMALFQDSAKQGSIFSNALLPSEPKTPSRLFFERYPKGLDRTQVFGWQWCRIIRRKTEKMSPAKSLEA